jgi:hypothetical protein
MRKKTENPAINNTSNSWAEAGIIYFVSGATTDHI